MRNRGFLPAIAIGALLWTGSAHAAGIKLLNVSYDPTRELYQDVNSAFAKSWKAKTGQDVSIQQSHGGSGKQAR
ncbi:MAG TPA: sulfate transporter subunit, partial [Thermoanaerobaculia bacterium]